MEEQAERNPEVKKEERETQVYIKQAEEVQPAPRSQKVKPEAATPKEEEMPVWPVPSGRLRKKVKPYRPGDLVEINSLQHGQWMLDGEVAEVLSETVLESGVQIPAGSIRVVFQNATQFEWVATPQLEENVRPSHRPRPPKPCMGALNKE